MSTDYRAELQRLLGAVENDVIDTNDGLRFQAAVNRARTALAQPEPEAPTDKEIEQEAIANADTDDEYRAFKRGAFFVQERISRPTIKPVPVAERLPGPEDCAPWPGEPDATHWAWAGKCVDGGWEWSQLSMLGLGSNTLGRIIAGGGWTHWFPHNALPVPGAEVG